MADFNEAYLMTLDFEGGYNNDPEDAGGETYKGISRVYFPDWRGWVFIDAYKSNPRFPETAYNDGTIDNMVETFYKEHFWNLFWGDKLSDQAIANELFDTGVNQGVHTAIEYLQKGLNVLNRNQKNYPDIVVDGVFGNNTLSALKSYLAINNNSFLLKVMNILQGAHYIEKMTESPLQERNAFGWLKRVTITKN